MGPLLFLIYINDLPQEIPQGIRVKLFADDLKMYCTHKTKNERKLMKQAIINLENWSKTWKLPISVAKTYVMYLGKNNPREQYKLNDIIINEVESIKDLGIIIDNKLSFSEHYNNIVRTAYLRARTLLRSLKSRSIRTWVTAYKSYVRPLLEYAPEIWSPNLKKDIVKLEKCQKYFTKAVLTKCRIPYIPYQERLKFFGILSLENRRKVFDMTMAFKILNGLTDISPNIFNAIRTESAYNLRPRLRFKAQNIKTSHSFINRTSNTWNKLEKDLIQANNVSLFKEKFKKWLIKQSQ